MTYRPNPMFEKELLRTLILEPDLKQASDDIADAAKAAAPVDEGDYRDGIETETGMGKDGIQGRVNATWWTSHFIEFGTDDTPTFAPMRRGAEAAGYSVKE
jgi:hypothetical protein